MPESSLFAIDYEINGGSRLKTYLSYINCWKGRINATRAPDSKGLGMVVPVVMWFYSFSSSLVLLVL
jgi:hypothetical protein